MPSGTAGLNRQHQQERMNNMPEISLEDLLKAKAQENTAAAAPVAVIDQQQEIMQVTKQTETLTPAERGSHPQWRNLLGISRFRQRAQRRSPYLWLSIYRDPKALYPQPLCHLLFGFCFVEPT